MDNQATEPSHDLAEWAGRGVAERCSALLNAGADPNSDGSTGSCALIEASKSGHLECIQLLLSRGAKAQQRDKRGRSSLSWSALRGATEAVCALIDAGAPVDTTDADGQRPLDFAIAGRHAACAVALIQAGAPRHAKGKWDESAASNAARQGFHEVLLAMIDMDCQEPAIDEKLFMSRWRRCAHCATQSGLIELGSSLPHVALSRLEKTKLKEATCDQGLRAPGMRL